MFLFVQHLLGVFILQEQESYQNTLAFIHFPYVLEWIFFTVYHKKKILQKFGIF